jgi:hypothetical protein
MENISIGTRVDSDLKALLETACRARGEDVSHFILRSVKKELAGLSFLTAVDKNSLGINRRLKPLRR